MSKPPPCASKTVADEMLEKVSRIEAAMFGPNLEGDGSVSLSFGKDELRVISDLVMAALEEMEIAHGAKTFKMSSVERTASADRVDKYRKAAWSFRAKLAETAGVKK